MDIGVISVRYARALLKSATATKEEESIYQDMQTLLASYVRVPQLRQNIDNPMLDKQTKLKLLQTACGNDGEDGLTKRFLQLVINEGRENVIQFIAASYVTLYRKQKNIIRGNLITATAVTPEIEQKMRKMVESRTQGTVEFQTEVDPEIIGGFILEYDTYRMDSSVKRKLSNILNELKK